MVLMKITNNLERKGEMDADEYKFRRNVWLGLVVLTGVFSYSYMRHRGYSLLDFIPKYEFVNDIGSSLIVKDIRGDEPYMTFKVKCLYCDEEDYGKKWETLMEDEECHTDLFDQCLSNRTVPERRETHVLNFIRRCNAADCSCLDYSGWCHGLSCKKVKVQCCLDTGPKSVLCRVS